MNIRHTYLSISHILLFVASMSLAGCVSREYAQASGQGWIDFTITAHAVESESTPASAFSLTVASADGAYAHTWDSASDYPKFEPYSVGRYFASAYSGVPGSEGYGCPCYAGETAFEVVEATYSTVNIDCRLTQAVINLTIGDGLLQAGREASVTLHSAGNKYVEADTNADGPVFLTPGVTYIYVTVSDGMGGQATVAPDFEILTEAEKIYDISVDIDEGDMLRVSSGDIVSEMSISSELFQTPGPSIEAQGFTSGSMINILEGFPATEPIKMVVNAPAGLSSAILTSVGPSADLPLECDLLDDPSAILSHGLIIERQGDEALTVDFTKLLENVGVSDKSYFTFMLQARDRLSRVSRACILQVAIKSVDLQQSGMASAMVGSDFATIEISLTSADFSVDDFDVYILDRHGDVASQAAIVGFESDAANKIARLDFAVDQGLDDIPVRIDFMGNPKLFATVERIVPQYDIFVDAFAMTANIYVTSEDDRLREIIIKNSVPMTDGNQAKILARNVEDGCITISQLAPSTAYAISTVLIPGRYAPMVRVTTEKAEQVPAGDFEDFEDLLQYKRLPCGGAYSNTVFPIFNMQNYTTIDVKWPQKYWAGTNSKTFCKSAARHNTWYMYPSSKLDFGLSASGSKSMMLQSVGWSLDGEEISPYTQEPDQQLAYNANVPFVAHRAAGKAFLGTYRFDPTSLMEVYDQGVAFGSRPRSLNGFYQFESDVTVTDYGLAVIELVNDDGPEPISVATGTMRFSNSAAFTAFNIPLTYHTIGVKATKLRIMFASSYRQGDIEEEDADVPATADPEKGMFVGSTLRIDNLSFSY